MRLFDFAFVPNYPEPLDRLKALAANEHWGKAGRMLRSYFNHMFDKVIEDGLLSIHPDGQSAVFHTGLLTRSDQDIYAVFVPNERDDAQDWFFRGFSTSDGLGLGDILQRYDELPVRPRFITRAEQAFYAPQSGLPECAWLGLLEENVSRIPRQLIHDATEDRILLPDLRDVGKDAYMDCLEEAARRLRDDKGMDLLVQWFEAALDRALDLLHMDYKLAVPAWHAKGKCVALMLPLQVRQRDTNVVLAVKWDAQKEYYVGINLLTMEMAYNNARLIARPEASWLVEGNQVRSKRINEGHRPLARSDR
ncbi:MAG: hypothetical protein CMD33_00610 [Flavobacteriales bacterium]|mgnify:CR=1 FL=1|nr:hypothetical protein [Flavobacteriales bacterium]